MTHEEALNLPDWFWQALSAEVGAMSRQQLAEFAAYFFAAAAEVRPAWEGPFISDEIGRLSEDSTEELTSWIVYQGPTCWTHTVGADDVRLRELFWKMHHSGEHLGVGYLDAAFVYEERFNEELDLNTVMAALGI